MFRTDEGASLILPSVDGVFETDGVPQGCIQVCDRSHCFLPLRSQLARKRFVLRLSSQLVVDNLRRLVNPKSKTRHRDQAMRDSDPVQPDPARQGLLQFGRRSPDFVRIIGGHSGNMLALNCAGSIVHGTHP
jgi:hypothetical protein